MKTQVIVLDFHDACPLSMVGLINGRFFMNIGLGFGFFSKKFWDFDWVSGIQPRVC
jgi:hypothetical protein